jgi:hypothetical protein
MTLMLNRIRLDSLKAGAGSPKAVTCILLRNHLADRQISLFRKNGEIAGRYQNSRPYWPGPDGQSQ